MRFACIISVGVVHLICALMLILRPNMMAFRVGGALESLQEQYFLLNLCFSMVTFDLQAQVSSYSLTIHTHMKGHAGHGSAFCNSLNACLKEIVTCNTKFTKLCNTFELWSIADHIYIEKQFWRRDVVFHNVSNQMYVYRRKGQAWWW